jgi:phenylacetate-coenzyme A ligase PaaK-like adenylate-forming protein
MKITPLEKWISAKIGNGGRPLVREDLRFHQLQKLRETISRARARSPFYRKHLAGVSHDEPASIEDLRHLPFTTADHLTSDYLGFLCVSQDEISRVVTLPTSGTTGIPKRICFTPEDQELTTDFFHHGITTLVGPGDRVLILLPGERPGSVGDLLARGLERAGAVGIVHGPVRDVQQTLGVMRKERVSSIVGIPVQVLALAQYGDISDAPGSVLLSTDYVPESITRRLEHIWGCKVHTHYGMTEMGFGGAVECDARAGYHMREADLFFEIVDPETGTPVEPGDWGEIVFTTLTRRGMPLIRYRTGDISRFLPKPCPCGTILGTMARVRRRLAGDVVLAEGIRLNMAELDEALFRVNGLLDFNAEVTWEGSASCLQVRVTAAIEAAGSDEAGGTAAISEPPRARIETEILLALDTVAAVQSAKSLGILDVAVRMGGPECPGPRKRTLVDKRRD